MARTLPTTDFQLTGIDKQQFLELIAQKANTLPEKLQIQLGQRQVFGPTPEGLFVDDLSSGRLQVIAEALQHSSIPDEASINGYLYSKQNAEIEIKSQERVLFREESDGIISVNTVKISPQIEAQNKQAEVLPEYNSDTVVYLNEPGDTSTVAKTQSNKLPNSKTKQFLQALLKELSQKSQQVVQSFSSISRLKQEREVASTAIQLLDNHYQQTQEHSYQAEGYRISLEADNTYVVSDKVRELMRIKAGGLTGPRILSNQMNKFHHLDFDRVRKQIQKSGIEGLSNQPHQRIKQLGNLAPQGDSELINAVKVQQVKQTAMNFLASTGISFWEAGDKGNYSIESVDDDNLEIRSAKDDRGVILKLSNGKLESSLEAQDFVYFQQLRNYSQVGIQSNQQVPVRPRIAKAPIISDLANSNLRNLASLIAAKNVLDAFGLKSYESESFRFEKQNNNLVVKAKDGRGEIARLQNGQVTGKVLDRDVIHFSSLNQAVQLTSEPSSSLIDLASSQQTKDTFYPNESSYTKLAGGIEME
jgi:hypothetical protein